MGDFVFDVVVIGAGLAGLAASRSCMQAGLTTATIDANDTVGGRVRSHSRGGRPLDLGAEWVTPHLHHAVTSEMERYQILSERVIEPDVIHSAFGATTRAGPPLDAAEALEFSEMCAAMERAAGRIDFEDPRWHLAVDDLDVPMGDYLASFDASPRVRSFFLAQAFSLAGADERRYSAMHLLHEFAAFGSTDEAFDGDSCRVSGGAARIAAAIAGDIDRETTSLGTAVSAVTHHRSDDLIEVTTTRGAMRTRTAIVAVPLNVLRGIELELELSDAARQIIETGHVGSVAKLWCRSDDLPQPYRSIGWPDVPESYGVTTDQAHLVAAFQVVRTDDSCEAVRQAMDALRRRHPGVRFAERVTSNDWVADPLVRGTWCAAAVGQQRGLYELAAHGGPCFFAGADLSRRWVGWMDGALTSGADAADRVIAFLRTGTCHEVRG